MPIVIEDLLEPISRDQPSGTNLYYAPVTEQIKEARRQEDNIAQGVWKRDVKAADYAQVVQLARQALTEQGKDLQIAAWLTEALVALDGYPGLRQGLELLRRLLEGFWDTIYPQIDEDGDLEMRANPIAWVGTQLDPLVRSVPVVEGGHGWFRYKESRGVPSEEEANRNMEKAQLRQELLDDGRLSPEEFAKALESTPAGFYERLGAELADVTVYLKDFGAFCDWRFGEAAPDFGPLTRAIEEVAQTVHIFYLDKGGGSKPAVVEPAAAQPEPAAPVYAGGGGPAAAAQPVREPWSGPAPVEPGSASPGELVSSDAVSRIAAAAHDLRRQNPGNPAPYLVLRALRWGEIRAGGAFADPSLAEAPPGQVRIELKRLAGELNWAQVIETAEAAMAQPCGRAWLDLQRYVVRACRYSGNDAAADAICSELRALIADYPQLAEWSMTDDTAAANTETIEWMREENILAHAAAPPAQAPVPEPLTWDAPSQQPDGDAARLPPDAYQLAMQAAAGGRANEAIHLLREEALAARCGRERFLRKTQLVQICLATGNHSIALPILRALVAEIERRQLEDWEDPDMLAQPLQLLYGCLSRVGGLDAEKQDMYARLCRIDPARALGMGT
jgi:type VI secretion system protein ImpA